MDENFNKRMLMTTLTYKRELERIIQTYSQAQYQNGQDMDIYSTKDPAFHRYMRESSTKMNRLQSKSVTDLGEDSDNTLGDSQLDITHQDLEADETCATSPQGSVEDDSKTMTSNDTTVSSLEVQPEDQDEELEMTLRSNGSSLVELYPGMVSRMEGVYHRQRVSEAADSVLRRYRKWRQQSNRSNLSNTFIVPQRDRQRNTKNIISQMLFREDTISPAKKLYMVAKTNQSPLKEVNMKNWQAQQQSTRRMRREQHRPVLVMDFSGPPMPNEISLNETFTVSEEFQLEEQPYTYKFSPSRPSCLTGRPSLDLSLRPRRLSLTAHSSYTEGCSANESETMAAMGRSVIYSSPLKQSPSKARVMSGLSLRSPHAFSRSPRARSTESLSREPPRHRFISVPPPKPTVPQRKLYLQDSPHSFHPQLRSPQPASSGEGQHRLRRSHSVDSSPHRRHVGYSAKKLDEDYLELFHKYVCQNKASVFNGQHCRFCARRTEANSGPHSSLAALALSPSRSLLIKRHREQDWDRRPRSKRFREADCPSSPTFRFHRKERRPHSAFEYEQSHDGLFYGSTNPSMPQRFCHQQRSAETHQDTWMNQRHHLSAAGFSGMGTGRSFESRMASGSSHRLYSGTGSSLQSRMASGSSHR